MALVAADVMVVASAIVLEDVMVDAMDGAWDHVLEIVQIQIIMLIHMDVGHVAMDAMMDAIKDA